MANEGKAYVSEDMQNAFSWKGYGKTQTLGWSGWEILMMSLLGFAHVFVARAIGEAG
jgi:hypothetical protein